MKHASVTRALAVAFASVTLVACDQGSVLQPEATAPHRLTKKVAGTNVPATVLVKPGHMSGWAVVDDNGKGGGSITLVKGPEGAPKSAGSARFELTTKQAGWMIYNTEERFIGLPLASITSLSYATFIEQANSIQAPALQFNFDDDVTDNDTSWKGRIVFEPYINPSQGPVVKNTWQTWDAGAPSSRWWLSSGISLGLGFPQGSPGSLEDILAVYPNAGINGNFGGVLFKAGSGWPNGFVGYVDAFAIGIDGQETLYNFEGGPSQAKGPKK